MKGNFGRELESKFRQIERDIDNIEKTIYGRVTKTARNNARLVILARYDMPGEQPDIIGKNQWIALGIKAEDVALRFGEVKVGDRVAIKYKGNKPWKGLAYPVEEPNEDTTNSNKTDKSVHIIYPPGGNSVI